MNTYKSSLSRGYGAVCPLRRSESAETLVPKLCLGMPSRTLRVPPRRGANLCHGAAPPPVEDDAERRRRHSHAERGNEIPVSLENGPSVFLMGRYAWEALVPKLCLGMPSGPLRGPAGGGRVALALPVRERGRPLVEPVPPDAAALAEEDDAERRRRHSHAERGNEFPVSSVFICVNLWMDFFTESCRLKQLLRRGHAPRLGPA